MILFTWPNNTSVWSVRSWASSMIITLETQQRVKTNNLFTTVAQHTACSLQTLLFGDPELNPEQNCDIFDVVQHFITLSKRFD